MGLGCVVCGSVVRWLRLVSWGGVSCGEWDEDRGNGSGMICWSGLPRIFALLAPWAGNVFGCGVKMWCAGDELGRNCGDVECMRSPICIRSVCWCHIGNYVQCEEKRRVTR